MQGLEGMDLDRKHIACSKFSNIVNRECLLFYGIIISDYS